MKILSIDVGIKNLAFCLFEKSNEYEHFNITKWDIINLSESESLTCCFTDKNGVCNKPAKFKKDNNCYCIKHSKKQQYCIPTSEQKPSFVNKQTLQKLHEIANSHNITYNPKIKKAELVILINDYIQKTYFETIATKKANEVDLFNIGINIKNKFNELFKNETKIDYVIIENQIGPLAIRMKTIQGMIVQYFVMSHLNVEHIEFVSASNKLKDCDVKEKEKYSDRKKLGIAKCLEILTQKSNFNQHIDYFNSHKKKDDLSDSFLQGLWFINNRKL
jgi:Mitochondrial resolvase Ydc2 / RNA splicing MRS1